MPGVGARRGSGSGWSRRRTGPSTSSGGRCCGSCCFAGDGRSARSLRLDRGLTTGLYALGRRAGATPFMTLLAAFLALLHRVSGQADLRVGTPASGRGAPELAGIVGYLVNPVVVRGDLVGDPTF